MIATAKLIDFAKLNGHYRFRIHAKDHNFYDAIEALKYRISSRERAWDPETKTWSVKRTPANEAALRAIFTNADHVITMVEAQLTLF